MTLESLSTARRFAEALDAEDYATAQALLAGDCVYHVAGATIIGPSAIIESYRANGESAKERFGSVAYASEVSSTAPSRAAILFRDLLRIGDERHEFNCRQHLRMNSDGLVEEIHHEELSGQRERLKAFETRNRS